MVVSTCFHAVDDLPVSSDENEGAGIAPHDLHGKVTAHIPQLQADTGESKYSTRSSPSRRISRSLSVSQSVCLQGSIQNMGGAGIFDSDLGEVNSRLVRCLRICGEQHSF